MDVSQHVNNILDQMLADQLSPNDFNSIEYINKIFPNEQSLSNIDEVLRILKDKIRYLDNEIRTVICSQKSVEENGRRTLEDAQQLIITLTNVIKEIKTQAKQSEKIVNEITCNIKQLDNAKRNLTASIIMLNNLHILVHGTSILKDTTKKRQYGSAAKTLQGILDVLKHFSRFQHIPHILKLTNEIENVCKKLGKQILDDFYQTFDVRNVSSSLNTNQIQLLAESCLVLSILEPKYKQELLNWFVDSELSEYKTLFQDNQDIAWLDKIDKRFAWLKKHLIVFEEKFGFLFPPSWEVSECIAVEFCKITQKELIKVMNNRSLELNVELLLPAISKATAFEKLLSQRFAGVTLRDNGGVGSGGVAQNEKTASKRNTNPFGGLITICFENYLHIYVEAQDKNFEKLIEQFVEEHNKQDANKNTKAVILPSSGKLFTQYKNCLIQCILLSNRTPLVLLSNTFQKYLREYAHKILQSNIPRVGSTLSLGSISSTISSSTGGVLSAASSAAGFIQTFLKDLENKSYTVGEIVQLCSIILTANYCLETTQQLEKKIQEKIDTSLLDKVNMNSECDIFHSIIVNCVKLLTHSVEYTCEQPLVTMIKTAWSNVETPIGQSHYVTQLISSCHQLFPVIRENLHELPSQYYQFCSKFATTFIAKFIANLYRCKPLSQGGAEQLLLDSHTLKKTLLELPEYQANGAFKVPQSYSTAVVKGMTKAEMILKIVLVSHTQPEMFVENYFKLFHEKDIFEFQKILDMKGIKKSESTMLCELFRKKCFQMGSSSSSSTSANEQTTVAVVANSSPARSEQVSESVQTTETNQVIDSSRIKRLEKLIKKRL